MPQMKRTFQRVRKENLAGRLYPIPDDPNERSLLDELTKCDLVLVVPSTSTSLAGYMACGVYGLAQQVRTGQA
jgi:hypothetical protein